MAEDALAFRILRLAKPNIGVTQPLKLVLEEDTVSDNLRQISNSTASPSGGHGFADRVQLHTALDACGVAGSLLLSKSFREAYLGESFVLYVSLINKSGFRAIDIGVKVELQTARQKVVLYDTAAAPLPLMGPGHHHDFMVQHDIKELGMHTLVCSAVYTAADGERRYFPENFNFSSANPLMVKTKTRQVGGNTFLEACIENNSKAPMCLEYVRFDAAPQLIAHNIDVRDAALSDFTSEEPLQGFIDRLQVLDVGCSFNHLFRLSRQGSSSNPEARSSALGKLEIKWQGSMGDVGRLQTQQILGAAPPAKEVEAAIVSVADNVVLERPFTAQVKLQSHVDRQLGPLLLTTTSGSLHNASQPSAVEDRGMLQLPEAPSQRVTADILASTQEATAPSIVAYGVTQQQVDSLPPHGSKLVDMSFVALSAGVQQLGSGLVLQASSSGRIYDRLQPVDVIVQAQ